MIDENFLWMQTFDALDHIGSYLLDLAGRRSGILVKVGRCLNRGFDLFQFLHFDYFLANEFTTGPQGCQLAIVEAFELNFKIAE